MWGSGRREGSKGMHLACLCLSERMRANASLVTGCLHSCGSSESIVKWVLEVVEGRSVGEKEKGGKWERRALLVLV